MRYSAFVSYTFADKRVAIDLHRRIETYRIPKHLRGRDGPLGTVGRRLPPLFRDRDELSASADLATAVREALDQSAFLIVICSPAGARSRWVDQEIRHFIATGRRDRIRCLIVEGEPHAADPALECLPPALLEGAAEPLAADARPEQDGRHGARLKLIAGLLGVPYDELRQRELQRRVRRLVWLAAGSLIGLLITATLAVTAYLAKNEAETQRNLAVQRTRTAERTTSFITSLFEVSDPSQAQGREISARSIVDRGALNIRRQLDTEPSTRASLALTLGEVYTALGLYHEADALLRWSSTIPGVERDIRHRRFLAQGDLLHNLGRNEAAVAAYRRVTDTTATTGRLDGPIMARAFVGLGQAYTALGEDKAAAGALREGLRRHLADPETAPGDIARDYEAIGQSLYAQGDDGAAGAALNKALALRLRHEGLLSPSVSDIVDTLGAIAYSRGDLAEAERLWRSRLSIDEKVLGRLHPDNAIPLNNLARVMIERREFAGARPLLERAIALSMREREATHPDMAFFFANLAIVERETRDTRAAMRDFGKAWAAAARNEHRNRGPILVDLAYTHCRSDRPADALPLLAQARPLIAADYPEDAWRRAWLDAVMAYCLRDANPAVARAALGSATSVLENRWPRGTLYRAELERIRRALRDREGA